MVAIRHLGFLKFDILTRILWPISITVANFVPLGLGWPISVTVPNFVPIGRTDAQVWPFFDYLIWRPLTFSFLKVRNFNCRSGLEGQCKSSCQILCWLVNCCRDIPNNEFSGRRPSAILNFLKFKVLAAEPVRRLNRHLAKQLRRCGRFWICKSWKFYLPSRFGGPMCTIMPTFAPTGQTVPEIWPYFDFSRWRPSAILDF